LQPRQRPRGAASRCPLRPYSPGTAPGSEPDLRRWILGYAILAPHSHNLQSWLVDLRTPGEIVLRCDRTRLLPETDPFSRQIMMSHGTFLELLDIAARERGQRAEITLFPKASSARQASTTARWRACGCSPTPAWRRDPLFAQILQAAAPTARPTTRTPGARGCLAGDG
jgi:hypothetical protein